jgi:hypothetical protein
MARKIDAITGRLGEFCGGTGLMHVDEQVTHCQHQLLSVSLIFRHADGR